MTTIQSKQSNLAGMIGETSRMAEASGSVSNRASGAASGLDGIEFSGKSAIAAEIRGYAGRLSAQQQRMGSYRDMIRSVINEMDAADSAEAVAGLNNKMMMTSDSSQSAFSLVGSEALSRNISVSEMMLAGGAVTGAIGGLFNILKKWLEGLKKKQSDRYVSKLPDWAKESPKGKIESFKCADGSTYSVYKYNNDGNVSCTYYTLRKLKERGLGFPFKKSGAASGKSWYENSTDDCPKAAGKESIQALLDKYGGKDKSIENVVVSFAGKTKDGHVLLIDKVYVNEKGKTMVKYTDNYDWTNYKGFYDISGDPPLQDISLDDFIKRYEKYNTNPSTDKCINGAVLIGAAS